MSEPRRLFAYSVYLLTVFLSAFLLFQVQPLIGRYILPWFGGSPAVWTTCMLFFQVALFGGYVYAHVLVARLSPKMQAALHVVLLGSALSFLPIIPDAVLKAHSGNDPSARIVLLLALTVGLPYFALSATGPLLQGWFVRTFPGRSPYRLYALSNVGSLLALLSYPFLFEPALRTETQAVSWSWGFGGFVACGIACAVLMTRSRDSDESEIPAMNAGDEPEKRPTLGQVVLWFALAGVATTMLLATTNQVSTDIAVIPFLWVMPLSLYLLTFILCFDSDRWYRRGPVAAGLVTFVIATCYLMLNTAHYWQTIESLAAQIAVYFGLLFCACMACHGELVRLKPEPRYLTHFYLSISAGGAIGGLFVGLVAPMVFDILLELHFAIVATCVVYLFVIHRDEATENSQRTPAGMWLSAAGGIVVLCWVLNIHATRVTRSAIALDRNFYGVLRVHRFKDCFVLKHGQIRHGHQFVDAERRNLPTTYYGHQSGAGLVLRHHKPQQPHRVGLIGLGAGTLAAYAKPGDYYRFYEINPAVVDLAKQYFTYLPDCRGELEIVVDDGRIALEREPPQEFDALILDAFTGDAIPTHLLTVECCQLYLKHLKPDGVMALHINNRHLDLRPVCGGLAEKFGLEAMCLTTEKDESLGTESTVWILMSRSEESLASIDIESAREVGMGGRTVVWTDQWSNLLSVMGAGRKQTHAAAETAGRTSRPKSQRPAIPASGDVTLSDP